MPQPTIVRDPGGIREKEIVISGKKFVVFSSIEMESDDMMKWWNDLYQIFVRLLLAPDIQETSKLSDSPISAQECLQQNFITTQTSCDGCSTPQQPKPLSFYVPSFSMETYGN